MSDTARKNFTFLKKINNKMNQNSAFVALAVSVDSENKIYINMNEGVDDAGAILLLKETILFLQQKNETATKS